MKKTLFLLLLYAASTHLLLAQSTFIPNANFILKEEIPCPFNPDVSVLWPTDWMIYQTLDDTWMGTIDSTRCISGKVGQNGVFVLDLSQIDPDRSLFVRQTVAEEDEIILKSDFVYELGAQVSMGSNDSLLVGNFCEDNICSGVILSVEIPNEAGDGVTHRLNTANFSVPAANGFSFAQSCFVTEYFPDGNILKDIVMKFKFDDEVLDSDLSIFIIGTSTPLYGINRVEELVFPQSTFTGESYSANIREVVQPDNPSDDAPYLFVHDSEVYPAMGNVTYIEGRPEVPVDEPVQLRAVFHADQSIHFQPYTELRGALVEAGDTARHQLTLVGDGVEFCFPSFVELVVGDGAEIEFRSGNIHFGGPNSCIMLREGGRIGIPDNTRFVYGNGVGALGLDKGGTIRIGSGSELVINNTAILPNYLDGPDRQFYMELNPGSRLTFGEDSRLIRKGHVEDGHMLFNVYMKGGILDDSRLSARDRRLINRIYPEETKMEADWLRIQGNPSRTNLRLLVEARASDPTIDWTIRDLNGRALRSGQFEPLPGMNRQEISLGSLSGGMYLLEVQRSSERLIRKFVVSR
ncbi:T9SS type A sorting domain-containing protein [Flavilitoribacter nigricans]|uniref:Secretion system C-terminal sorting domain-containing protein n=1 Tax=Flavilitoribacter nigricans (strain ATCC 23147 / DSM 23189 / NBRC 102662 / NCIMB 1420 / SS-2) TaxID=1122177 RepID=A0A2D0NAS5_FLAN2|nr:T9SS type A sorting domain-containing protein [Flavilitoribacter nigricans]PHN05587.1 hypothetical protein CRP01_16495 [Flavilitoribacter nigricans DSM 23189 = NBRC 102662]